MSENLKILETKMVPIEQIKPLDENPRFMDDAEFNALVVNIQTKGFGDPLTVWWNEDIKKFELVKGHRRFDALKYLDAKEAKCNIATEYKNREEMLMDAMADNINVGHFDPMKMTELFNYLKAKGYTEEEIRDKMGITSDKQLSSLIKQFKKELPPEMADELDKVKDEIKTIDDLSIVLNRIFATYGSTLPQNMLIFDFGGKDCMWVRCEEVLWKKIMEIKDKCVAEGKDINETFIDYLK